MPQLTISKEQYIKLRKQGMSQQDIVKKYTKNPDNFQGLLDVGTAITDAVGGSKVAETFGTEIARIGKTPQEKATIESMAPTVKQTAGSALQVGSLFTPFGTIANSVKGALAARGIIKGASLAGNVAAGAAGGYAYDVGGALAEDKSMPLAPRLGTALGAAIPAVATGIASKLKSLAGKTPEKQLQKMTDELSSVKKAFERNSRYEVVGGQRKLVTDPISTLSKYKIVPEVNNYKVNATPAKEKLQAIMEGLSNENSKIIDSARKEGVAISVDDFEKVVMRYIQQDEDLKLSGRTMKIMKQAKDMLEDFRGSFGDKIDAETVDGIREAMNKVWNVDEVDGARAIGNATRQILALSVPETRAIMQREGEIIGAMKFLDALNGKAVTGGKLGRYFSEVIGGMIGQSTNIPVVGTALGALGARAVSHKIAQSYFQPMGSKTAQKILGAAPKFTSPGDMFVESQTGKAVTNYAKNVQPGLSMKNVVPKELEALAAEARKYKSAEEFVSSIKRGITPIRSEGILFRGEGNNYLDTVNINKLPEIIENQSRGTYFSKSSAKAAEYGSVKPYLLSPDAKIAPKEILYEIAGKNGSNRKLIEDALEKQGFDGYINQLGETVILNQKKVSELTPFQLTDFYNQVMGKK